jgi:phosphatidate phosphatase PAH1
MRFRAPSLLLAVSFTAALGCVEPTDDSDPVDRTGPPQLAWCVGAPFIPAAARGWDHLENEFVSALGPPGHSMQDVIATPGAALVIQGKFAYGSISKDLEGEKIRISLDDSSGWRSLGEAVTDSDGRVAFAIPDPLAVGVYDVRLEALGDASVAPGRIWVLPAGTRLAIADIDGTLTTSDGELVQDVITDFFAPIYSGDDVPSAWPGGAALTHALADRAWVVVYLTGRPYWLTGKTRDWLSAGGFARGALHTTDSNSEALPSESGAGAYKLAFLDGLTAQGFVLDQAYGNANTDVFAYGGAGISPERTWIIGPNGGAGGTWAVDGSWQARVDEVLAGSAIVQPFSR